MCMFIPLLVTATLPADNGGASAYSVGDIFAGGTVLCVNSTGGNYTLPIEPEVEGAALIVFALQPADLFTQNMASANSSLDSFLSSDAVGAQAVGATSYLFLAYGRTDAEAAATTVAFRSRILDRIMATKNHTVDTLARMHFGAQRVPSIAGLNDVLAQWTTPINSISVQLPAGATLNISRLDGKYEVCDWPSEGQALPPLVDAGSGCKPLDPKVYEGKTAVVRSDGCSPETAVRNGGNIIVAAKGRLPTELSSGCRHGAFATVVSSGEGTLLFTALASAKGGLLNASLLSRRAPGAFVAIDAEGKLQEVGWEKYSTLEMLAWSAQYFDYLTRLRARLIRPHFSVPIRGWKGGRANVSIPPADLLRLFSTMEVENVLTCSDSEGRMDQSCPAWDHNIALGVACGASHQEAHAAIESQLRSAGQQDGQHGLSEPGGFEGELARYITPFRRRLGHWLTPATHMMPLLTQPSKRHCAFSLANPGWVNDFTLRFSGDAWGADGAPPAFTTNLFQGGNFGSTYNLNRTLLVPPPITINVTRKVELALILSGHGKMRISLLGHVA